MKRIISLICILALTLLTISCAAQSEQEKAPSFSNELDFDLSDYTCVIYQHDYADNGMSNLTSVADGNPFGYVATTIFADDMLKRIDDVQNELTCKIEIVTTSKSSMSLSQVAVIGEYEAEILFSPSHYITQELMRSGALYPLDELEMIDITDENKWGGANVLEIHSQNGRVYGVCPMYWLFKEPRTVGPLVFNTGLSKRFGLENPREYLENGEWTWDTFENVLISHTVDSGAKQYYAIACRFMDFVKLSVYGNGCSLAYFDDYGNVQSDISAPNMLEALSWVRNLAIEHIESFAFGTNEGTWEEVSGEFINENALILLTAPPVIYNSIVYEIEDFSILPFPTGPSGTYGKWPSILESAEAFSIFLTAKEPEVAATVISMLCEPMDTYPTRNDMITYLRNNVLYNDSDAEVMLDIYKNGVYSYWTETAIDDFWRGFQKDGIITKTPAEIIAANENLINNVIEQYIAPNLGVYELFK